MIKKFILESVLMNNGYKIISSTEHSLRVRRVDTKVGFMIGFSPNGKKDQIMIVPIVLNNDNRTIKTTLIERSHTFSNAEDAGQELIDLIIQFLGGNEYE